MCITGADAPAFDPFSFGELQDSVLDLVIIGLGGIGLISIFIIFYILYLPFGINTREKEKGLVDRFKSTPARTRARCMSVITSFCQAPFNSGSLSAEQTCGPCPPSIGETPNQQG